MESVAKSEEMNDRLYLVGWTTVESLETAERLARLLVKEKLAGCVQIDAPHRSFYHWKGDVQTEEEYRLWVKTRVDREPLILKLFESEHPYDAPQWITAAVHSLSTAYGEWMKEFLDE